MATNAQLYPPFGSAVTIPNPLPTEDMSDGQPGSTNPSTAIQVGGTDGNNLRILLTDSKGRLISASSDLLNTLILSENSPVVDRLDLLILEIRALKTAVVEMGNLNHADFDSSAFVD